MVVIEEAGWAPEGGSEAHPLGEKSIDQAKVGI